MPSAPGAIIAQSLDHWTDIQKFVDSYSLGCKCQNHNDFSVFTSALPYVKVKLKKAISIDTYAQQWWVAQSTGLLKYDLKNYVNLNFFIKFAPLFTKPKKQNPK